MSADILKDAEAMEAVARLRDSGYSSDDVSAAMVAQARRETSCANCGEPWPTAEQHLFGEMYDGEWCCSAWCEQSHADDGCPLERPDGGAEMVRRRKARNEVQS